MSFFWLSRSEPDDTGTMTVYSIASHLKSPLWVFGVAGVGAISALLRMVCASKVRQRHLSEVTPVAFRTRSRAASRKFRFSG